MWDPGKQQDCEICKFYDFKYAHSGHVRCPDCWASQVRVHQETARKAAAAGAAERAAKKAAKAAEGPAQKVATRAGKCPKCGEPIVKGEPLEKAPNGWVHVTCPTMTRGEIEHERRNLYDDPKAT